MPTALPVSANRDQSLQEELLEEMFDNDAASDVTADEELAESESPAEANTAQEEYPTEIAAGEVTTETSEEAPDPFAAQRANLQRRLTASTRLPLAVRNRLGQSIAAAAWNEAGEEQPALAIGQVIDCLEQSLPRQFTLDPSRVEESEHRYGDAFFSGSTDQLDDRQAAQLAAEQLAATGFGSRS